MMLWEFLNTLEKIGIHLSEEDQEYLNYTLTILGKLGKRADFLYTEEDFLLRALGNLLEGSFENREKSMREFVKGYTQEFNFKRLEGSIEEVLEEVQREYDLVFTQYRKFFFKRGFSDVALERTQGLALWVYKKGCSPTLKKVCLPVDFSERSLKQVQTVEYLRGFFEFEFDLVHSLNTHRFKEKLNPKDYESSKRDKEEEALQMYRDVFGERQLSLVFLEGSPYKELIRFINSAGYDFVIVGRRGRGMRENIGSVSLSLLRGVRCPVLVL